MSRESVAIMNARIHHLRKRACSLVHGWRGYAVLEISDEQVELCGPTPMAAENARHSSATEHTFIGRSLGIIDDGDTLLNLNEGSRVHAIRFARHGAERVVSVEADAIRAVFVGVNTIVDGVEGLAEVRETSVGSDSALLRDPFGGSLDVVKVDIEGAEWEILDEVGNLDARVVGIEVHPWLLPNDIGTGEISPKLQEIKFVVTATDDPGRTDQLIGRESKKGTP